MVTPVIDGFLEATVRSGTPLAFAAIGELIAERSGVINIGIEGSIACGAFASYAAAQVAGPEVGFLAGGVFGALLALCFALFVVALSAQQIVAGAAVSMLGLGLSASLHRAMLTTTTADAHITTLHVIRLPLLSDIPLVGSALFAQPGPTYVLYVLVLGITWLLYRTVGGIALRAVGEHPPAVVAAGHSPAFIQFSALIAGGFLAGLGGATLVVAQTGTFSDGMSAGRGFIAIAVVALGRWTPRGVIAGSLVFGAVSASQYLTQAMGWRVPYTLLLASPYVLTLCAMTVFRGSRAAPSALGKRLEANA